METSNTTDRTAEAIREYGCLLADIPDCGDRFEVYLVGLLVFTIATYHPGASDCYRVIRSEWATRYNVEAIGG